MNTSSVVEIPLLFRMYGTVIFLLCCVSSAAQELRFERIANDLGLSQNLISALYQDQEGFIWVGTKEGLNRFDGYRFVVYRSDPFDSTSISNNFIKAIFEDSQGRLWVGTSRGLNMMDRSQERFYRYLPEADNPHSLAHQEVNDILEDGFGNIWVATAGAGLSKISATNHTLPPDDIRFTNFNTSPSDTLPWPTNAVKLLLDQAGDIWVKGHDGLFRIQGDSTGLHYQLTAYEWRDLNAQLTQFKIEDFWFQHHEQRQVDDRIYNIFPGQNDRVWVQTSAGFALWDPVAEQFHFKALNANLKDYPILPFSGTSSAGMEDRQHHIWIGGYSALVVFDPVSGRILHRFHQEEKSPLGMPDVQIRSLLEDKSGIIWVGTNGKGLYKYVPQRLRFNTAERSMHKLGKSIRAICQTRDGIIWLGATDLRLYQWQEQTDSLQPVILDERWKRTHQTEFSSVSAMLEDRAANLWVGGTRGLTRFVQQNGQIRKWKHFPLAMYNLQAIGRNGIKDIYEDKQGKLWLMSLQEFGWFDPLTETFKAQSYLPVTGGSGTMGHYPFIHQQEDGIFWLGTSDGLLRYDPVSETFSHFASNPQNRNSLSHNAVKSILPDPDQPNDVLWIGTSGGLNRFTLADTSFQHFGMEEGLPDEVIYGILADERGRLWMSTNQGLSRLDRQTMTFRNYYESDGLQDNEFNSAAFFKNKQGLLFFGGINGVNVFDPNTIQENSFHPPVVITDFQISNKSIDIKSDNSSLQESILTTRDIHLSYADKVFSFGFSALDFTDPSRNQYAYKLEGFDDDWQHIGKQRTATFTNIDPGEYIFHVKGTNSDGIWNESGDAVRLFIHPPWWRTWWATGLFVLTLIGGGLLFYQFNLRRQLAQQEARRLRDLDELKSHLYTNITHEFRTPLTVILGMTDQLPASAEIPDIFKIIRRNSQNLLKMVNQLLDLARLESGRMPANYIRADIIAYLRYLTESLQSLAADRQLTLSFHSNLAECQMDFDETKMQQIIYNLLSNAIKFTPQGGWVRLQLDTTSPTPSKDKMLLLTIEDNGIGITKEQQSHIFDRFYQVDASSTRQMGGTGIGLALTKELVEWMGGEISLKSTPARGTAFYLVLPIHQQASTTTLPLPKGQYPYELPIIHEGNGILASAAPQHNADGPTVLIIEDNADVIAYIRRCLAKAYTVEAAADGEAGVAKAIELIPDLIISDVMMPQKDGYAVTHTLKNDIRTSHIPIILLTAKATQQDKVVGLQTGADAYLTKPFHREELEVRVKNLIALRQKLHHKYSQAPFTSPTHNEANLEDQFLGKIIAAIHQRMDEPTLSVEHLCQTVFLSHTQLYRKIKALTNKTPTLFIRSVRLQKAKEMLSSSSDNVSTIAYAVGFRDANYFSRVFQQEFGMSPSAARG